MSDLMLFQNMPQPELPPPQPSSLLLRTPPPPQIQPQPAPEPVQSAAPPVQPTPGKPELFSYKNRLQEYTQRAGSHFPMYQTKNEGSQHAPKFRSTVIVNGESYSSPNFFSHRKTAEQDAARIALISMPEKAKEEEYPLIEEMYSLIKEDTIFCKSILNEYAVKLNIEKPMYTTNTLEGLVPVFVSSIAFNGKLYTGERGRNKKESQQLAARTVILSVLESESRAAISEIIKSKNKLYVTLNKVKNLSDNQKEGAPMGTQTGSCLGLTASKGDELEVAVVNNNLPRTALPEPCTGNSVTISAPNVSLHEFRPSKVVTSTTSQAITTPIEFVLPTAGQLVGDSTSGRKRKRKNKKTGVNAPLQVTAAPMSQPSCSVAQ